MELDVKPKILSETKLNSTGIGFNLYIYPPVGNLTLEESEDLFRQRLEALHIMEKVDPLDKNFLDISKKLRDIKSYVFKTNCIVSRHDKKLYLQDHFSHMLARMYCVHQFNECWQWFKINERRLFYFRLRDQVAKMSCSELENILRQFNFNFRRITGSELGELTRENVIGWSRRDGRETVDVFEVKFLDALKFVSKRQTSLKNGYAYLSKAEIISVVCDNFEKHLESEVVFAHQHLNLNTPQAQRLMESLDLVYQDFKERKLEEKRNARTNEDGDFQSPYMIDIENLDQLVKDHYPPCMRHIQEALSVDHHLKHQARLHYGAFLRSGGVTMDNAIEFWRKEFTKLIPNDKFERDYKYNIRHLYGKEGHKKALSCFSCDKIINDNPPGPSEKHGCPFKHFDESHLRTMMSKHGLKSVDIDSVMMHKNGQDHKLACTHYFKFLKGDFPSEPIKNPIHFYFESRRIANSPPKEEAEEVPGKVQDKMEDEDIMDDDI